MKITGLNGYVYDFSVDYASIAVDDILDIQKYFLEKNKMFIIKCLDLLKKMFAVAITFFIFNVLSVNSLECISMKIQECKVREEVINVNTNNPVLYPFSVKVHKCSGDCNNISDPYARLCVPNVDKNIYLKVFNLMSWSNQTKQIKWHESCRCECRLILIICNNKQKRMCKRQM